MNTLIGKLVRQMKPLLVCSIVTATLVAADGVNAADGAHTDWAEEQTAVDHLGYPASVTGSLQVKSVTVAETVKRFRVHRSPVRSDSVALSVVTLDTEEERTIELHGVAGMSFNKICRSSNGVRTACGSRARVQFVNFVTRREITCAMIASAGATLMASSCAIDGVDVADWIVRSGVGRPTAEGLHVAAVHEARMSNRGMWADAETREGLILAVQR